MGKKSRQEQQEAAKDASCSLMELERAAEELGLRLSSLIVYEDEEGVQRLNPLYLAAISEQLQFDGDIPELRIGAMPEGVMPAVPIETDAMDLVAIGLSLEKASKNTLDEIKSYHKSLLAKDPFALSRLGKDADLPAYRRGRSPSFVKIDTSGSEIAILTDKERQNYAWKALSSTPGRKSVAQMLEKRIEESFPSLHRMSGVDQIPIDESHWQTMFGGKEDFNPGCGLIGLVWKSFHRFLEKYKASKRSYGFEVKPVNRVSDRQAGWSLYLYEY